MEAEITVNEKGDDTVTAKSVEMMCRAWRGAGCDVKMVSAGKVHHKELIQLDASESMALGHQEATKRPFESVWSSCIALLNRVRV